jgi:hypothetical protein
VPRPRSAAYPSRAGTPRRADGENPKQPCRLLTHTRTRTLTRTRPRPRAYPAHTLPTPMPTPMLALRFTPTHTSTHCPTATPTPRFGAVPRRQATRTTCRFSTLRPSSKAHDSFRCPRSGKCGALTPPPFPSPSHLPSHITPHHTTPHHTTPHHTTSNHTTPHHSHLYYSWTSK